MLFSLPAGTKMFQFPALAPRIQYRVTVLQTDGLSHSEIRASRDICSYTRLIAAYHVLHRLCEPRHPPYALTYFRLKLPTYIYIISEIQRTRTSGSPYFKLYYLNLPKGKKRQQKFNFYFYKSQKLEFFITVLLVPTCQRSTSHISEG